MRARLRGPVNEGKVNDGVATVPVFANGLSPGDKVRVKAGWKYFPGVDDVTLEVI
jgi:hypothetical protein